MTDVKALREAVEPVAWQWRSRIKGGAWDAWERGRFRGPVPPFAEVEERPLYTCSAPDRLTELEAEVARLEGLMEHMVPIHKDGSHVFIDGPGDVELDHGGKLRAERDTLAQQVKGLAEDAAKIADELAEQNHRAAEQSAGRSLHRSEVPAAAAGSAIAVAIRERLAAVKADKSVLGGVRGLGRGEEAGKKVEQVIGFFDVEAGKQGAVDLDNVDRPRAVVGDDRPSARKLDHVEGHGGSEARNAAAVKSDKERG